jgi:RNA-directed DNA polymerase
VSEQAERAGIGVSLATPIKLKRLQRTLYSKAKCEASTRFHFLYDKLCRMDVLEHAYARNRENGGAPGVDGQTFEQIEAYGVDRWLAELQRDLQTETYRPSAVRRVMIPKPNGQGERLLGIPTIRDRVVQMAGKLLLEPIFEAGFDEAAYGYRPRRSAEQAIQRVQKALWDNHAHVIDADLSRYFDTIPHVPLMKSVARRVSDAKMLHLIKMWLKAPVEVLDAQGKRHLEGGKHSPCGTPQGGVLSPLLANLYMHRFIQAFRKYGLDRRYGAVLVVYADDFVVLCQRNAAKALEEIRKILTKIGLTLNEAKTSVKRAREESFDFLGYTFRMLRSFKTGAAYPGAVPGKKAVMRLKSEVRRWLSPHDLRPLVDVIASLNRTLRGWANYFRCGSVLSVRAKLDHFVDRRVRRFLVRRCKVRTAGTRRYPRQYIFGELGVISLSALPRAPA